MIELGQLERRHEDFARRNTQVPMSMGQDSLAALTQAMSALVHARASIVTAHAALADDKIAAGLRIYGMGDLGQCPSASGALTLVDQERSAA